MYGFATSIFLLKLTRIASGVSIWGSRSKKGRLLNSNGNDIERRNEASILASFSISKQNEPAYSRTCKDRSEANPAYSTLGSSDFPRSLCFM